MRTLLMFVLFVTMIQNSFSVENEYVTPVHVGYIKPVLDSLRVKRAESYIEQICPQYKFTNGASSYVWDMGAIQFNGLQKQSQEFIVMCDNSH